MIKYYKNDRGLTEISTWKKDCWINCEIPSEYDKDILFNTYNIPVDYFNDVEDVDERPRIEFEDGWFLVIVRLPYKDLSDEVPFTTVPLGIMFKDDIFVTVCFYETEIISDFIHYTKRKERDIKDNFDFALRLLLSSSVWFLKYLKQINQTIKGAEDKLEKSVENEDLQTLLDIVKSLVYFTTSLRGNDTLVQRIKNLREYRDSFDEELLEDVEIEMKQAIETTRVYSSILSGMMDAYASVISNNLNVIMKQLTSISLILMIPTLIASVYGMNVPNFLEENNYGLFIVLLGSFLLSLMGVYIFMRRKWF